MGRPIITIGCKTSHGGTVVSSSMVSDIQGKGIARVGDKVPCPLCKGNHVILSGDFTMIVDGAAVARDGDKTSCGAVLIANQMTSFIDQNSAPFAASSNSNTEENVESTRAQSNGTQVKESDKQHAYDLQFQLNGKTSGRPMVNVPYKITLENGDEVTGITDAKGLTQLVSDNSALMAKIEAPYYGNSGKQINAGSGQDACHC
jgi:uncharacterized Zn-binding protein involved in type VI secretion